MRTGVCDLLTVFFSLFLCRVFVRVAEAFDILRKRSDEERQAGKGQWLEMAELGPLRLPCFCCARLPSCVISYAELESELRVMVAESPRSRQEPQEVLLNLAVA